MRILVIDDEAAIRAGLQIFLERRHSVGLASSATEGIDAIQQKNPDAILLDMHMEGGNGDVVLDYLVKNSLNIPVIVTSAFSTEVIHKKFAAESEKWVHLRKPIDLKKLTEILDSFANAREAP
ncbi:MAG: response regulator [Deltaproteobacteria bacterium]|nr:response regulator [Deltaproteobacteria bacterium]